ncbi:MAG: alpha/beta fold hydrolase [Ignavibacteriaceae bacterium]
MFDCLNNDQKTDAENKKIIFNPDLLSRGYFLSLIYHSYDAMQRINNLNVYTKGNKKNRAVLFVHGFPFDHRMWDAQVAALEENYFCILYDIRGLGESLPGDGQYTMESFVDDLESIIDHLNLNKPVLCGLSMGGYISLRSVERMQHKFSALILCDTKSEADTNEGKIKRAAGIKQINIYGVNKFVSEFLPNCFSVNFIETNSNEYNKILQRSSANSPLGIKGCLLAMAGRTDTTGFLGKIEIPSLLICGQMDTITPPSVMKNMSDQIQNSKFVIINDAAHMAPVEKPDEVNLAISEFLAGL